MSYTAPDRERFVAEQPTGSGRGDFERDRARVLHSSALRRLAAKTQVMGLGAGDFPRTRLTHSLECAQIGREIAGSLGADPDVVDAACLAHDLGHPPFGHNGETVLDEIAKDAGGFEGNAQSLRILTRLEAKVITGDGSSAGLNLTRATLDAATKYPWPRRDGVAKWGCYDDDLPVFEWIRAGAAEGRRPIEAQIMDWSDDVAYSVHDLEDGIHAGLVPTSALGSPVEVEALASLAREIYLPVPHQDLVEAAQRLWSLPVWVRSFDGSHRSLAALKSMTSALIGRLCQSAIAITRESVEGPICRYAGDFVVPETIRAECAVLKAVAARFVMSREAAVREQARQREQLAELAEAFFKAPEALEPWLRQAWALASTDAARTRVVVDQVASLTDTSALTLHARLVSA